MRGHTLVAKQISLEVLQWKRNTLWCAFTLTVFWWNSAGYPDMTHMQYLVNASLVNSSLAAHLIHWIRAFAVLGDVALVCLCCSAIVSGLCWNGWRLPSQSELWKWEKWHMSSFQEYWQCISKLDAITEHYISMMDCSTELMQFYKARICVFSNMQEAASYIALSTRLIQPFIQKPFL